MHDADALLHESNREEDKRPFFSVCIPQYNRTEFLIESMESFRSQRFRDFEICISDGHSTDGKQPLIVDYLRKSGLTFIYSQANEQLPYDRNLRRSIGLSKGGYVLLMGNDDELADPDVLQDLYDALERNKPVAAAVTNYYELGSGRQYRRTVETNMLGDGPYVAARTFRNYSFLSGVMFQGDAARDAATDALDGSEMYQMYLGTHLVAQGGRYLGLDRFSVNKDIQIPGRVVDGYQCEQKTHPCPIVERHLPMGRLLEVVAAGLEPHHTGIERDKTLARVATQLYQFTYPFWIIEFRRVQSWRYAVGVLLALRPSITAKHLALSRGSKLRLWATYIVGGAGALIFPIRLFEFWRPRLHRLAKEFRA